jgi:hypothetical protein
LAKAKKAHDELVAAAFRAQADALEIEAAAKRRLADEYDAAQERGEIAKSGDTLRNGPGVPKRNAGKATAADVGLSRKEIHEARAIRDAEERDPGIVQRTVDAAIAVVLRKPSDVIRLHLPAPFNDWTPKDVRCCVTRSGSVV